MKRLRSMPVPDARTKGFQTLRRRDFGLDCFCTRALEKNQDSAFKAEGNQSSPLATEFVQLVHKT